MASFSASTETRSRNRFSGTVDSRRPKDCSSDTLSSLDPCVLDIGANCGIHTVLLSKLVGDAGAVLAFEPVGYNQRKLHANLALNGCRNVTVFPIALGEAPGQATLREVREDAGLTGNTSLVDNEKISTVLRDKIETKTVEVDTIDNVVERHGIHVAFIKMDVEGYEYNVLLGARNTIAKQCPILILEYNPVRINFLGLSHRNFADLLGQLYDCYEICDPDESDDYPSLEPFAFDRNNRHDNLLSIPKWKPRPPLVAT